MISTRSLAAIVAILFAPSAALAGSVSVSVVPPGAEVLIINQNDFRYCEARGIPPWDPVKCTTWRSLTAGSGFDGDYCALARWSGGVRFRHAFKVRGEPYRLVVQPQPAEAPVLCR